MNHKKGATKEPPRRMSIVQATQSKRLLRETAEHAVW